MQLLRRRRRTSRHTKFLRPLFAASLAVVGLGGIAASPAQAQVDPDAAAPNVRVVECGGGEFVKMFTPQRTFDPLTATDAELEANALPTRPKDAAGLATWKRFMAMPNDATPRCPVKMNAVSPPPPQSTRSRHTGTATPAVGASYGTTSANWSGNVAFNQSYTDAYGAWTVPYAGGRSSSGYTYSSTWVGVGQGGKNGVPSYTQPLSQAGTESNDTNEGVYYLWWELYPENSQQGIGGVNPGDSIYAHAHLSYNDDWMIAEDLTTGLGKGQSYGLSQTSIWPDNTAEWIFERTEVYDNEYPLLADAAPTFTGATALGTGYGGTELENLPHYYVDMTNCNTSSDTELAAPGAIGSGGGFPIYWFNEGSTGTAGCTSW